MKFNIYENISNITINMKRTKKSVPDVVYKAGYKVPNIEDHEMLKKMLTVSPVGLEKSVEDTSFPVYRLNDKDMYIPHYCGVDLYGKCEEKDWSNCAIDFKFNGKLRGSQPEVADFIMNKILENGGGLLQLHTGYGKTTLAIYLASLLKLRTLVIVHKTFLQDQWIERIKQFSDASIGTIRQKKTDVKGKDIIIGMLQSISMINYDPSIFDGIGLVVVDECHHVASKVFSRALFKINPKHTIGLSATPKRTDGLTKVIHWFLGDTIVRVERQGTNAVYVKAFMYNSSHLSFSEKKKMFQGVLKPDTVKMTSNICELESRNKFLGSLINALRLKDRKILVISKRINHLKIMKKMVDDFIKLDIKEGKCCDDEYKTAFYVGGMPEYRLNDSAEADIIFATYDMASEGLDIDGLNTLVLATPKKDIVQTIGRIMRKPIEEGDVNPLIVDVCDELSCFGTWSKQRLNYYKENKYSVDVMRTNDDKCVKFEEYMIGKGMLKKDEKCDLRDKYLKCVLSDNSYNHEVNKLKCRNYPEKWFNYSCDLNDVFEINHTYDGVIEQKSIINYNPVTVK